MSDIVFILGAGRDEDHARQLIQRFRGTAGAQQAQEGVWHYWSRTLGVAFSWSMFNWVADVACLAFACYAAGGHPSLAGLTVAPKRKMWLDAS